MKQLKFEHSFVKDIIEGSRRTTIRIDDKHLQVGETVQVVDKVSSNKPQEWEVPGELTITGKQEFILSTLPLELLKDAEIGAANREQLYTFLRRFYGESISEDTVITLFTFQFEAYQQPVPYLVKTALEKENKPESVFVYADGGSRGNPGPSAAGFVIESEDKTVLQTWNKYLGITTNNQAEYHGLVAALEWCKQQHIQEVHVRLDSLLVVNQMNGQ
ncbi:reverse transcriptase-like protein, partial [Candidatus Saccharibacteria bacterium]|nr:reverse transcriptase-like protein [Candidatus Saccharibacteria bacterium]